MYKFLLVFISPLFLYAQSGVLLRINDGDTAIFKNADTNSVCHLGDIDALEILENDKLKMEMKECPFPKDIFIKAGQLSHDEAKSLLKIGQEYSYEITRYLPNKNPVCYVTLPKGLHVELYPQFDNLMVERGFALPYIIYSDAKKKEILLEYAKEAKIQKKGLWKDYPQLMQCLVEKRYSLRSLR